MDDLIGKPFKKNGRGPDGYDCYGLCLTVCRRLGINLPEYDELCKNPANYKFTKIIKPDRGDLALILTTDGRHVAVMENSAMMLQVVSTGVRGVHRISINHPWVKDRVQGFYRYIK